MKTENYSVEDFKVLGISHWNTPVAVREKYSLNEDMLPEIKVFAEKIGLDNLILLSTCNRSELYAFTTDDHLLASVFNHFGNGDPAELEQFCYEKEGTAAVHHLFEVANGLDSQILGDFQIIAQLKSSYQASITQNIINTELSRLVEMVIQSSKKVKRETQLSSGAASTAYAAVQHIKSNSNQLENTKVLLIGTGKIGRVTCKNLVKHLDHDRIRIINRTKSAAEELANAYDLHCGDYEHLDEEVRQAGIIVVATGAPKSVILPEHLAHMQDQKIIIDLSVPRNVHPDIDQLPNINVIDMDQLEDIKSESFSEREASVPRAKEIIQESMQTYCEWMEMRSIGPTIHALKNKLQSLKEQEMQKILTKDTKVDSAQIDAVSSSIINNITKQCIQHLKKNYQNETLSVKAIQEIFDLDTEPQA